MEQNKTTSQICNLGKILSNNKFNKIFIIPPYQRLYAWKDEQIKALLDDFRTCINDNNKAHFIGNVVVANNEDNFELVDGQQRLSTIFFLCVYMCREDGKMQKAEGYFEKAYKFAFVNSEDNNSNNHKCRIHMPIREDDENAIWNYDFDKTNANIRLAFNCFDESLKKAELKSFCDFIFTKVEFNLVILGDQVELNKYFVRMNNTGVQLDGTDILKARLLKLISDNDKSQVTEYARIFDECSQMNYFSDFGFVNNSKDPNTTHQPTIENIIKNQQYLQNYSNNDKDRAEFESIIDFPTFILHVFKILSRQELKEEPNKKIFKEETQISIKKDKFLENTWDKLNDKLDEGQAKTIIEALQDYRIIFDAFVIKKKLIKDEDKAYYGFYNHSGDKLDSDKTSLYDLATIQNYLRVARRGDNANYHHFLTHYLEFCKNEIVKKEKITREECLDNLKDSVNTDNLRKYLKNIDDFLACKTIGGASNLIEALDDFINQACTNKDINFDFLNKGTNTPHYWFYRLEYYLLISNYSNNNESYRFRYVNSVEHVLAQNDLEDLSKDEENKKVLNNFGNLALITDSENSTFSNNVFTEKKRIFDNYKNKDKKIISLKLLDVYEKNKEWKKTQIEDHQKAMLEVLQKSF
ncbi:DUF262 domain-containing protein [Campylobacter sp. RM12651]|uniref:DUF262 domain-containing protein n=1 Tax=Campylobacter sp. RM12651 TaxID=1660079 RepID=UPI001EFC248E|nr:DUF262 domain-containing protein [Campylobacter sp. RM12651]ULO03935.1 DUF262 and DUF1524 domain-containing protein [Campylobacter sp. RM12651]